MGEARRRRIEAQRAGVEYVPTYDLNKRLRPVDANVARNVLAAVKAEWREYRRAQNVSYDQWVEALLMSGALQARGERMAAAAPKNTVQIEPYTPERAAEIAAGA